MKKILRQRGIGIGVVAAAGVMAMGAHAFTAGNTVPTSKAGSGTAAISGYSTSNVAYTFNAADPTKIDSVAFDLNGDAGEVRIKLVSAGSVWYDCVETLSPTHAVCDTTVGTQATAATADSLSVAAKQ